MMAHFRHFFRRVILAEAWRAHAQTGKVAANNPLRIAIWKPSKEVAAKMAPVSKASLDDLLRRAANQLVQQHAPKKR